MGEVVIYAQMPNARAAHNPYPARTHDLQRTRTVHSGGKGYLDTLIHRQRCVAERIVRQCLEVLLTTLTVQHGEQQQRARVSPHGRAQWTAGRLVWI